MSIIHLSHNSLALKLERKPSKTFPCAPQGRSSILPINAVLGRSSSGRELIESGAVRTIVPKEAAAVMKSEGFKLLDVRTELEWEKAHVPGSLHIPLFVKDMDDSPVTLLKKWVHFGYIGIWTGKQFTTINPDFVSQIRGAVPDKETSLLVACGEGLRSVIAVSKLHEAGYRNLGWLEGGFTRAKDGDFLVEGVEKLQYATIGGVSYFFLKLLMLLEVADDSK